MSEKESEEDKLVAATRAGDRDAFGELVERHFGRVFRTTRRITRHREDAEDVVQESLANTFVHLESFTGASRFSTWLTRIGRCAWSADIYRTGRKSIRTMPLDCNDGAALRVAPVKGPDLKLRHEFCSQVSPSASHPALRDVILPRLRKEVRMGIILVAFTAAITSNPNF
jgi:DNA-directed RNA polymerase specialized sigma24 family protein